MRVTLVSSYGDYTQNLQIKILFLNRKNLIDDNNNINLNKTRDLSQNFMIYHEICYFHFPVHKIRSVSADRQRTEVNRVSSHEGNHKNSANLCDINHFITMIEQVLKIK